MRILKRVITQPMYVLQVDSDRLPEEGGINVFLFVSVGLLGHLQGILVGLVDRLGQLRQEPLIQTETFRLPREVG